MDHRDFKERPKPNDHKTHHKTHHKTQTLTLKPKFPPVTAHYFVVVNSVHSRGSETKSSDLQQTPHNPSVADKKPLRNPGARHEINR